MKVSELGEFGLIDLLARLTKRQKKKQPVTTRKLVIGIGDDAAAWTGATSTQLATIDSIIENVHFTLDTTPWKELGWKSLAVNLSDIAAMGGLPEYALVSLGLPADIEVEDVTALYEGMIELAQSHGVEIVGGDTCKSPVLSITITVLGTSQDNQLLRRAAAKTGDTVVVTGYIGGAAAGLEMLRNKLEFDREAEDYLKNAFLYPRPRVAEGQLAILNGVAAGIDISDGLLADLGHVCTESGVGARIDIDRLPIHEAVRKNFKDRAVQLALTGGEDYELLLTAPAWTIDKLKQAVTCPVTAIGEIVAGKPGEIALVDKTGKPVKVSGAGWEHFKTG